MNIFNSRDVCPLASRCCEGSQPRRRHLLTGQRHSVSRYALLQGELRSCALNVSEFISLAGLTSALYEDLGYPCYTPYSEAWKGSASDDVRRNILRHISFATTAGMLNTVNIGPKESSNPLSMSTVLLVVAIATFIVRFKGLSGRLIQVMRRDGGAYYIALAG